MSLYLKIKADQLAARKNKDKSTADTLSVILAQADKELISRKSEAEQDKLMFKLVLAYDKSLVKNIEQFSSKTDLVQKYEAERQVIAAYLPKQLDKEQIKHLIEQNNLSGVPEVMKFFSANYKGQFDAKVLKEIAENK